MAVLSSKLQSCGWFKGEKKRRRIGGVHVYSRNVPMYIGKFVSYFCRPHDCVDIHSYTMYASCIYIERKYIHMSINDVTVYIIRNMRM